ncbi:hypothetical protein ACFTS5_03510 [Nocardia sp. NPDC056952]|uniref:hypothetical protein n=1 Tax=Nocardia sp. NPDC056952 TaxID=3345979 RepID=UPI00363AE7EB
MKAVIMLLCGAASAWLISLVLLYALYLFSAVGVGHRTISGLVVVSLIGLSIFGMSRFRKDSRIAFGAGVVGYGIAVLSAAIILG